ncbi:MAG: hypothetical protein DMD76_10745 [Candidatus Rokuibacteriota bacterium]|nr:MAG: hypothetical protein DMD76_10745 [Candidatus Rokubacteria bacterium]
MSLAAALLVLAEAHAEALAGRPELPRIKVETNPVPPAGRVLSVAAGDNLQTALERARPGDVITLQAGATFVGPFTLPRKHGDGWVTIRTSAPDPSLPPPDVRVDPSYAGVMPKLEAGSRAVIVTAPGAHHYRFVGIEIRPKPRASLVNLVDLGTGEPTAELVPSHLIFDRCYLHGDAETGTRRGIAMNSRHTAVVNSYLADFKAIGADSQAIAGWAGAGPFKIDNNYLEAAGENLLFGGGDPVIRDLTPSDIEIRGNHVSKPLRWKVGDPAFARVPWAVKNLFELKNARRVLVEGNLFEHNWAHAQAGFAIVFTVRNEDGGAPWSAVQDVTFVNNIVRRAGAGVNILGRDNNHPSQPTERLLIANNLFDEIDGARWGGPGTLFQILDGTAHLTIEHNTAFQQGAIIVAEGRPHADFVYRNNLTPHNAAGIAGTGTGAGAATLSTYFPGSIVAGNVIAGGRASVHPPDNFFPVSLEMVGFVNRAGGNYRLTAASRYRRVGTDGRDPGVDLDALTTAVHGAANTHTTETRPAR